MPPYRGFIGGSYTDQNPLSDQEELINWYVEKMESPGATAPNAFLPTPGFQSAYTVSQVGCRAMFEIDGRAFGVFGNQLYEWFIDGTNSARGAVAIDGNPATICGNGVGGGQLFVTGGGAGYVYDLTANTLTLITGLVATQGGELYGYFVAFNGITGDVRLSNLFDGTTWDPTQFFERTIGADLWTAMLVTPYGQILLTGSKTSEFWYNAGSFPVPFAPDPSGLVEEGIAAAFSLKFAGKSAVWLATNQNGGYQVMRASGFTPQRVSTHALEFQISRYSRIDDALGETYEDQGHAFYLLTFPTAKVTWAFDFATGQWAKRLTFISQSDSYDYAHAVWHCFAFNKHLMADRSASTVYQMDISFTMDVNGRPIRRLRRTPATVNENKRIFFRLLELVLEVGLGTQTGTASDPQIVLRASNDGGKTWGHERQASAGKVGDYPKRVRWVNLGSGRKRVYEVVVNDPINNWRITEAYQQLESAS